MKNRNKKRCVPVRRVSFATIKAAKELDSEATMEILDFYRGYMLELCRLELYDDVGNKYICYDEDLYQSLQCKLIKELRSHFELR